MKRSVKVAASLVLLLGSVSAMADSHLTAEQCNDYPFKPVEGHVTHAQLVQELAELESVGYEPDRWDPYYPNDLQAAQARLHAKYLADCAPVTGGQRN
jgi:Domain of unknown function (DUF4148)